ncbi:adenylate/guanylate cyclase domain-containing protein [Thermodesulfobacteriota bacterium]
MKCSKCQTECNGAQKFCGECGEKLGKKCSKCGSYNPPQYKFCGECGQKLRLPLEAPPKDINFDERLSKLQRYLPKGLTEKILTQRDRIEGERKQVTVMFCDMADFTSLTENLGSEDAYKIMDQVYEILIRKVHDYGGTVNEMTGDGIMGLFGAPIALENAPERAIRAAYGIHREMAKFSYRIKEDNIPPLKMRIGIHTGPVVVGALGNDLRVEFKAVGDTVNLASRMEGLAESGSTYVTEETFKLTEGFFRFEALGEYTVKGKEKSFKAYRVIAASTPRTRFDVSAELGLTPFVGREREVELLQDGFERSKTGRGQAFSIMSEAGVGKSRLLYEFRKAIANEEMIFMEGKCLSYCRNVAFQPIVDIVKSNLNILEGDTNLEIREKLEHGLNILGIDDTSTFPYLLELLSVKDSGVDTITIRPEARKDQIIQAINRITLKASEDRPLIMVIEDLHWVDKSSEDFLRSILENIAGARVLLIFTYRPEFVHTWGTKSYHSQITLNRLSNRESLVMATYLLGSEDIDRTLEELILEKAEGVPFFIEEFIKSLKDLMIIEKKNNTYHLVKDFQKVEIPSTIQDIIMARVDNLSEDAKELLQIGSVIQREFGYKLIKHISGLPEQTLLSRLSELKNSELIFERGIYPDSTYIFKHGMTQEVVYDSVLSRKKKLLHNEIGQAIEQLFKDNLHEQFGVIAEHFINSENFEKGAEYCRLTGKKAEKTGAMNDAINYGKKQIVCLERLPQTKDLQKNLIDARTVLGLYYSQLNQIVYAKESVDPIVDLVKTHDYKKRLSQIYCIIGHYNHLVNEDISEAFKYFKMALSIGENLNDILSLLLTNFYMGVCFSENCDFVNASKCLNKSLELNVAANVLWGISSTQAMIACWVYLMQGKLNQADSISNKALKISDESGDLFSKGYAYAAQGWTYLFKGYFSEAKEHLVIGSECSDKINDLAWIPFVYFGLGLTSFFMEEYELSQRHFERTISAFQYGNLFPSWANCGKIALTMVKVMNKEKGVNINDIFKFYENSKIKMPAEWMLTCICEILLKVGDPQFTEAKAWINKAIVEHKRSGLMWHLAKDYDLYADLFIQKGDRQKASQKMNKAIEIFKICGADGWVEKSEKKLVEIL